VRLRALLRDLVWDLGHQRLRTSLTVLGIAWGTVAVVVLLAFGVGLERQTIKRFHGLGDRIVLLFGGRTTKPYEGFPDGRTIQLREEDVDLLQRQIPDIVEISPEYSDRSVPVRYGTHLANPNITGVYPVYSRLRNVIPAPGGRFIDRLDEAKRRRVAVLGDELAQLLFGDTRPLGKRVYVGDVPFTVIGVMEPKQQNSSYNGRDKDRIFIPASTHRAVLGHRYISNMVYRTRDPMLTKGVQKRVYEILGRKYKFDPTDKDALGVWDTSYWEKQFSYLFLGFNLFFALVGSFTLSVGGVGVANIMYIMVRERTREIGIRRSVGARSRDILGSFFAETFAIVGLGALFGFGLSVGIVKLLGFVPMQEFVGKPVISAPVLIATVGLLGFIGFLAGLFPARRAAGLDPVECLRT
jgi:putative ABC transport system permease protein